MKGRVYDIETTRTGALLIGLAFLAATGWYAWSRLDIGRGSETIFEPTARVLEPAPLCPWREIDVDLPAFFPGATRFQAETLILSSRRPELQQRLGRTPNADELSLRVYWVYQQDHPIGGVLTRRVKGENGAIELVVAVDEQDRLMSVKLQRLREPDEIARALQARSWLDTFVGKGPSADWASVLVHLPEPAQSSGRAIVDGIRSSLIMLELAERPSRKLEHH